MFLIFRYDWLEVRDGGSESSKLIGSKMCGSTLPQTIESSGNELFVKFHSDYSVVKTGYKIRAKLGRLYVCVFWLLFLIMVYIAASRFL